MQKGVEYLLMESEPSKLINYLDHMIEEYEANADLSIDEFISDIFTKDPVLNDLNVEDAIELKRQFMNYAQYSEERELKQEYYEYKTKDVYESVHESGSGIMQEATERYLVAFHKRTRPRKKYVEAFINNISVPKSLDELQTFFMGGNHAQGLIRETLESGTTCWTTPRWAKRGDIVLFMHAKYAKTYLTKLRSEVRFRYSPTSIEAIEFENAIAEQLAFHKQYGGKIYAVGRINGKPFVEDVDPLMHSKSRVYCDIDQLFLLDRPIDISEFNEFIKINRLSGVTPVFGSAYGRLKNMISEMNEVPSYFEYSYSTPFPHTLVNRENWMKLGLEYRNSFTLEIQFRQCYVDYLLKEMGDQKTIYMECHCYKGNNPVTYVDNVIKINKKLLPVEVKLNIKLESNLEGQCEKYCMLDKLVLNAKTGFQANMENVVNDRVLIIDTYAVYMFYLENKKIEVLYDLGGLRSKEDILELRRLVISHSV